jgi:2'-5' RNA ligase
MTAAPAERLRLFVAVELPPAWLKALEALQEKLRRRLRPEDLGGARLRWVRPEGIHVTLKFLGEVNAERLGAIEEALRTAVPRPPAVRLRLGGAGGFNRGARPTVVWAAVDGDTDALARLAAAVDAAVTPLGFPPERRPFAAHLTLARVPEDLARPYWDRLKAAVAATAAPAPPPAMVVEEVALMRSRLRPDGARYEKVATFPGS